ncbi:hypothetical protein ACHAQJ_010762 [Trichoderma viride]
MSTAIATSPIQQLLDSFNSLLDESLVIAIASDYDLSSAAGYSNACAVLRSLAQNANTEESSGFDPSGAYRFPEDEDRRVIDIKRPFATPSHNSDAIKDQESKNEENGAALAPLLGGEFPKPGMLETDILQLQNLFPDLQSWDIRHALLEANGVVATALDTLLSVQYFQSDTRQVNSPDALLIPGDSRIEAVGGDSCVNGYDKANMVYSENSKRNTKTLKTPVAITYIAERLNMSAEEVSIIYAENGNSRGATIIGILDQFLIQREVEPPTSPEKEAVDGLRQKFRNTPEEYLQVIIQITGPASPYAAELASLTNAYFSKRSMNQKLDLGYRLTPLPHEDIEGLTGTAVDTWTAGKGSSHRAVTVPSPGTGKDLTRALQMSNNFQKQKQDTIASGASLHRRGASNPLYRQAAGYYTQQAREHARRAQEATSAAADILVDQQSTDRTVDLHGVSVQDGVRIARQRALSWWKGLRESREGDTIDRSLTIITGLGRHNAGGISPLRKAVAAALTRDGWKLEVETGKFIIIGRG